MSEYSGFEIYLYPNGEIRSYISQCENEYVVGQERLRPPAGSMISFSECGKLQSIVLAQETLFSFMGFRVKLKAGETIAFSIDGTMDFERFMNDGSVDFEPIDCDMEMNKGVKL